MSERPTVLLVEDNPDDEELAHRAFARAPVAATLVVARDGVEALELLLGPPSASPRPRVVLLDLAMPRLDGFELLRQLRADARTRDLPAVVLTSSGRDEDIRAAYAAGATSYVQKPIDYDDFVTMVGHLAVYWLELNHVAAPAPDGTADLETP